MYWPNTVAAAAMVGDCDAKNCEKEDFGQMVGGAILPTVKLGTMKEYC